MGFSRKGGGGGSAAAISGYVTVCDFDFSLCSSAGLLGAADPGTPTTITNGAQTISANVIAATAGMVQLVPGVGIRFAPSSVGDSIVSRAGPLLSIPLVQFASKGWTPDAPIRVWAWVKNQNTAANYDFATFQIDTGPGRYSEVTVSRGWNNGSKFQIRGYINGNLQGTQLLIPSGFSTGNDIMVIDQPEGVGSLQYRALVAGSAGGVWPPVNSLQKLTHYFTDGYSYQYVDQTGLNNGDAGTGAAANWCVTICGERVGSATPLVVDFGRVRIDLRPDA